MRSTRHLTALVVGIVGALSLVMAALPAPTGAAAAGPGLGLGADGLDETRTTERLQPGVTLTTIVRGHSDPAASWTIEIAVPEDGSPDPDAPAKAIVDRRSAEQTAERIREAGYAARVEPVRTARVADYGGRLGYRVRIGRYAAKEEADAVLARIRAQTGLSGSSVFTGWDPQADSTGPWRIRVLRVDPRSFEGSLVGSYGPDLERREKTSELAALRAATAAVNAGFFVLDPAAGAPGDPAGAGVYGGALLSESVDGRPVLTFGADGRRAGVRRVQWTGSARRGTESLRLDGVNRVPGLVRNCGGTGDTPTDRPLHDVTCTDGDEVVAFSGEYAARTPEGPGVEVALDARGVVVDVRSSRGGVDPPGYRRAGAAAACAGTAGQSRPNVHRPHRARRSGAADVVLHVRAQRRAGTGRRRPSARDPARGRHGASRRPELLLRLGAQAEPAHAGRRRRGRAGPPGDRRRPQHGQHGTVGCRERRARGRPRNA
jgi:hypothetical protein